MQFWISRTQWQISHAQWSIECNYSCDRKDQKIRIKWNEAVKDIWKISIFWSEVHESDKYVQNQYLHIKNMGEESVENKPGNTWHNGTTAEEHTPVLN